jgi:hypothetical protein
MATEQTVWAAEIEDQTTDHERFPLLCSLMVVVFGREREPPVLTATVDLAERRFGS